MAGNTRRPVKHTLKVLRYARHMYCNNEDLIPTLGENTKILDGPEIDMEDVLEGWPGCQDVWDPWMAGVCGSNICGDSQTCNVEASLERQGRSRPFLYFLASWHLGTDEGGKELQGAGREEAPY